MVGPALEQQVLSFRSTTEAPISCFAAPSLQVRLLPLRTSPPATRTYADASSAAGGAIWPAACEVATGLAALASAVASCWSDSTAAQTLQAHPAISFLLCILQASPISTPVPEEEALASELYTELSAGSSSLTPALRLLIKEQQEVRLASNPPAVGQPGLRRCHWCTAACRDAMGSCRSNNGSVATVRCLRLACALMMLVCPLLTGTGCIRRNQRGAAQQRQLARRALGAARGSAGGLLQLPAAAGGGALATRPRAGAYPTPPVCASARATASARRPARVRQARLDFVHTASPALPSGAPPRCRQAWRPGLNARPGFTCQNVPMIHVFCRLPCRP